MSRLFASGGQSTGASVTMEKAVFLELLDSPLVAVFVTRQLLTHSPSLEPPSSGLRCSLASPPPPPQPRALPPSSPRRPPQSALLPGSNPRHLLIFDGKHEEAGNTAVHVPRAGSSLALSNVAFKLSFPRLLGEESD